jgi:hypothetical protein
MSACVQLAEQFFGGPSGAAQAQAAGLEYLSHMAQSVGVVQPHLQAVAQLSAQLASRPICEETTKVILNPNFRPCHLRTALGFAHTAAPVEEATPPGASEKNGQLPLS